MIAQNPFVSDSRVLRIGGSIARCGSDVTLLALEAPGLPARERIAGFDVKRLRLRSRAIPGVVGMPLKLLEYVGKVLTECLRSGAAVYHVHDPLPVAPAVVASWISGAKVIYDVHELHFGLPRASRARNLLTRVYESLVVRGVDRVIMSDGASRAALFRAAHRFDGPIEYVYNCPPSVDYPATANDLRAELGIPPGAPVVVFTGHVGHDRALDRLVRGMTEWPRDAHFVMIGKVADGAMDWLPAIARSIGVESRLHFYGPVPGNEVVRWMISADVASTIVENTGASYFNSAPTKMFEAIMARIPQVASDFPEIRRVVRDNPVGPVGELVDPGDTKAITDAVSRLLSDQDRRNEYRRNADQLARSYFNWQIEEAKLVALYGALVPELRATASAK